MILDREQINRATIGAGTIIVDGKETNPNINRDESKAQETTKDVSVDKVGIEYSDNRKEWSLSSLQDIFGEQLKEAVIAPMDSLNKKLKLYEKYDFFKSNTPRYKYVIEKDINGNIIRNEVEKLAYNTVFDKESIAHINGMNTDLETALKEVEKQHLMDNLEDFDLSKLKKGEKIEFIIFQNETHGNWSDLVESAYDKFGIKGDKKVYSEAAKEVGEAIYLNKNNIDEFTMFSQGNIQWRAGLEYIEEKYGVGVLEKIKTKKYTSVGSPLNAIDLITFLKNKKMIKTPNHTNIVIKNDNLDVVANIVGFNPKTISKREKILQDKIDRGEKYDIWEPHSSYTAGIEPTAKIEYNTWQKPFIITDKVLRLLDIKNYFSRERYNPIINKGVDENNEK